MHTVAAVSVWIIISAISIIVVSFYLECIVFVNLTPTINLIPIIYLDIKVRTWAATSGRRKPFTNVDHTSTGVGFHAWFAIWASSISMR